MSSLRTLLPLVLLLAAGQVLAAGIDFDTWPTGRIYGAGTHAPGTLITTESGIECRSDFLDTGSGTAYGDAFIQNAGGAFGSGHYLQFSNIGMHFVLPTVATEVSFNLADYGGAMNLEVNGAGRWIFGDVPSLDGKEIAPGVIASVSGSYDGTNFFGSLTLQGSVLNMSVCGAEMLVDRFEFSGIQTPDYSGESSDLCDTAVTYETQPLGTVWADPYEFIFEESGVPVFNLPAFDGSEEIFGDSQVVSVDDGVGQGHEARLTKAAHGFHLYEQDLTATRISWVVHNYSDLVCLQVNGDQPNDWHAAASVEGLPSDPAPGVTLTVTTTGTATGTAALLVLDGPVEYFAFGGLSLDMDNVCFRFGQGPVLGGCDLGTDMEDLTLGQTWTSGNSNPGDVAFTMGSVPVRLEEVLLSGGYTFDKVQVTTGLPSFHDGKVLSLSEAGVVFDMTGMDVAEFRVELRAGLGFENLQVNGGSLYMLDIANIPTTVAPGVTATFSLAPDGNSRSVGRMVLTGPVETVRIGGADIHLDNVCIRLDNLHTGVEAAAAPALLGPLSAYPNPFNPSTTVDLRLEAPARAVVTIHDAAGRLVRTLADGDLPAGSHALRWDGRDRHGAAAAAGVYFARAVVGGETRVAKLALIK